MVRQITATVPLNKSEKIRAILQGQKIVHNVNVFHGEETSMIVCKAVNKKTDEVVALLSRYGVGNLWGTIDVVALTSTKPRVAFCVFFLSNSQQQNYKKTQLSTYRGQKKKKRDYRVTDRMSYDEMLDFIDSQIHLTFDYLALIMVGAMICAIGLLTNSAVNVVASMVRGGHRQLSPFFLPSTFTNKTHIVSIPAYGSYRRYDIWVYSKRLENVLDGFKK